MPTRSLRRALCTASATIVAVLLAAAGNSEAGPDPARPHPAAAQYDTHTQYVTQYGTPNDTQSTGALQVKFGSPQAYASARGDTWYNTVDSKGNILATSNDTGGYAGSCISASQHGSDIAINRMTGPAGRLEIRTINCMASYGPIGGGADSLDSCSWKTGGITRIGRTIYLAVARQLRACNADQSRGLQPSFNASIISSTDDGATWTNPWGGHDRFGAAPSWDPTNKRYRAMFPGQRFSAPFFVQYGPGNTHTVDGADKFLYAVSNDGYAYDGNYLVLGRVPLAKVQQRGAWQFYHRGSAGAFWSKTLNGAAHVLDVKHGISQPAIQYVPALRRYLLVTFSYQYTPKFPAASTTPYTSFSVYEARHLQGPWSRVFARSTQRSLWCGTRCAAGSPDDHYGFYDPALVQKFVFQRTLDKQSVFTSGDFKNASPPWEPVNLYRLRELPVSLVG